MQHWIWRKFEMRHPVDWEMLHYGRRMEAGRCLLADRNEYRLEFNWRQFKTAPDWRRTLSDYHNKLQADHPGATIRPVGMADWSGLAMLHEGLYTSRFGRFFPETKCLVEIVFVGQSTGDKELIHTILESVQERHDSGGVTRWRAFGLDLHASAAMPLQHCRVEPARAEMRFGGEKQSAPNELFQRLGLVNQWLKGSVDEWLAIQTPSKVFQRRQTSLEYGNHKIACVNGRYQKGELTRWMRPPLHYRAAAWLCPDNGRLHFVACTHRGEEKPETYPGRRLSCCETLPPPPSPSPPDISGRNKPEMEALKNPSSLHPIQTSCRV